MFRIRPSRACRPGGSCPSTLHWPAVLAPALFTGLGADRFFFAETDGFKLVVAGAEQDQRLSYRVGALLSQRQVVLAAAAFVGVALNQHSDFRIGR